MFELIEDEIDGFIVVSGIKSTYKGKDLIKSVEAGAVVFTAGPFEDKSQVDALVAALKAAGAENISITESSSD